VIDCAALSPTLVEAELFGHERGAFTGADRARPGAFVSASRGTVFLDEIGELPIELQPRLLRVLERREVKRLGGTSYVDVDVRIVAATHRDLGALVREGRFREDLWHRLAEVVVPMPPLRARDGDVPMLARALFEEERARTGRGPRTIDDAALAALAAHPWPGNVRELRNLVRRLVATAPGDLVGAADVSAALRTALPATVPAPTTASAALAPIDPDETLERARARWNAPLEKAWLEALLARTSSIAQAARIADVHPKSLERLLRQHGLRGGKKSAR
jgi:transcriptional regulator with GAF, ATPase, and Fis domain